MAPLTPGESVSVTKHTDAIPDPRAVNQDKKNMLFSVSVAVRTSLQVRRLASARKSPKQPVPDTSQCSLPSAYTEFLIHLILLTPWTASLFSPFPSWC